jgi:hypothetical protein
MQLRDFCHRMVGTRKERVMDERSVNVRQFSQILQRYRMATGFLAIALLALLFWLANFAYRRIVLPSIYGDVARVEIIDGGGMTTAPNVAVLKTDVQASDQTAANEIRDAALAAFPSGSWQNVGPDAAYRSIRIVCKNDEIRLKSWHPLFETNPRLVVGSRGVTSLDDQSRAEYLRSDDPSYVAARNAFDDIDGRLMKRFSPRGSAPMGKGSGSGPGRSAGD